VALFADRFLPLDSGPRHLDLATGRIVFVRRMPAGDRGDQTAWIERASRLAGLWHPHLATLVDFGLAGADERFEAFPLSQTTSIRRDVARAVRSALWFLGAVGLSSGAPSRDRIREESGRTVLVPDAWTGHELTLVAPDLVAMWKEGWRSLIGPRGDEEPRPFIPGVVLQSRRVADGVLDLLNQAGTGRAGQVLVTGPAGSGLSSLSRHLAREARRLGFVPIAPHAFASLARGPAAAADVVRNRFLFVLGDGLQDPDGRDRQAEELLLTAATSGGPSAVLLTIARVSASQEATAIDPIPERSLAGMLHVFPPGRMARSRVAQAARTSAGRPGRMLAALGLARSGDLDCRSELHAVHVAETQPAYGGHSVASVAQPADRWEIRAARGLGLAAAGRHAAAERLLREAAAGLRRHGEEVRAAQCVVALGRLLLDRGRPTEARELLETTATADLETHIASTTTIGVCLIEEARLREAETALRAACAIGKSAAEASRLALARCLFWQARLDEAAEWIAPVVEADRAPALRRLSAIELARHETAAAGRLAASAVERAAATGDALERARGHAAAIRALAGIGERDAVLRHARDGLAAARAARAPLAALDVRLAVGLAAGADVELDRRVWRSLDRLRRDRLPPFWRARVDALLADTADDTRTRNAARASVAAFIRTSGAEALRPSSNSASRDAARVITGLLELCQEAEDDDLALGRACATLRSRLRASAVALFGTLPQEQKLASAGTFERGAEAVCRTLSSGLPIGPIRGPLGIDAAAPIRFAGSVVGALVCRWALDAAVEARALGSLLEPSAAAVAPAVRAWLDRRAAPPPAPSQEDASIVAASPSMVELTRVVQRAAQAPFPVLIEGESGVGKELVARAVHRNSPRRGRRFVAVNCAALPDDLIEAELFGHARGAFTGAASERSGLFEEADGGTLFLDEVSELAPRAQAKLLRAIQDGEIRRVGENMPRRLDVRLVAASNRPLEAEVSSGRFRPDLLFRLAVIRLAVPPLRERPADIHALAQRFWQSAAARTNCRATLDAETLAALARYDWPGNVRELQNVMSALAVHAPRRGRVCVSALPPAIATTAAIRAPATLDEARQSFERQFVSTALARAGGHHSRAAQALGVSRQGLAKLIRRLGLEA
jgi:DNA-binding NtrC family response regulator/tetratricopeptide (TPR) repeat protein